MKQPVGLILGLWILLRISVFPRHDTAKTVELAKMAVESGLWYLAENEGGEMKLTYKPKELKDPADYLKMQKRFKHLTEEDIQEIREIRDSEWARIQKIFTE